MKAILTHVEYLLWAAKAVKLANLDWRARRPYRGEVLMERDGLHFHLFRWAVQEGLVEDPGLPPPEPYSYYVSTVFDRDPEAVKGEARNYWRTLMRERAGV